MTEPTATPTKPKATRAEIKQRVSKVADLLVSGVNRAGILQYVAKQNWGLKDRQVDNYIKRATESFKQTGDFDRKVQFEQARRRMEMIIHTCLEMGQYGRAIAASKELHTLMGLYEPPAKQTLKIEGLDQFALLAEKARTIGVDITELLAAMLAELSEDDRP